MADELEALSQFVLFDEREMCQCIIQRHIGHTVGELQGGNDDHEIYRVSITENSKDCVSELMSAFGSTVLTKEALRQYMLQMCTKRDPIYNRLGNLMFILSFGPVQGQVRHIDDMDPNLQVCCYMSRNCPATIIYTMEGPPMVTNVEELLDHWGSVPPLLQTTLLQHGDTSLRQTYFSFWKTPNQHLERFGKLFLPVETKYALQNVAPGTTLLAGDNQVHAGPPTNGPRMFAFAIAIPEDDDGQGENDGEVQYNPTLLLADLCCIVFDWMQHSDGAEMREIDHSKRFLLNKLLGYVKEFPQENYSRLLSDDREALRDWLGRLVEASKGDHETTIRNLIQEGICSATIFEAPRVGKRRRDTRKNRKKRTK